MNPSHNATGPNPLGVRPLPQLLRSFAVPSVLAMLVSSLYNIVDQIFIGNGVGYLGNAATNVAFPLSTICLSIALLIGVGGAARFNLSLGRGDRDQAQRTVGAAVSMMVVLGLAYMVIVELFLPVLLRLFHNIRLTLPDFRPCLGEWRRIASLGLSNSCNQLAITFVQIVLNNSLTYYGALSVYGSEIPLAASGIVIKVNAILTGIIVGISQGAQPIISFNYGAGQYDRVRGGLCSGRQDQPGHLGRGLCGL